MSVPSDCIIRGSSGEAITADVEAALRDGRLQPGDPLPSIRLVAAANSLSPTTVAAAYRELRRRGRVLGGARRRLTLAPNPTGAAPVAAPPPAAGSVDLASGGPDPSLLPDHGPALAQVAAERARPGGYGQPAVDPDLAAWFRAHLGVEHLTLASGALDATERALAAWLRPGDAVAVEDPGYPDLLHLLRLAGLVPVPVPLDGHGPDPTALAGALKRGARAVVLTPRAQNPTGAALDDDRRSTLAAVLGAHPDVLVIEDDHFGLVAGRYQPLAAVAPGGITRWAWAYSVSKGLGPDLRLAALAGDPETVARVGGRLAAGPGWVSHLLQRSVFHLLCAPATDRLLAQAATTYDRRRAALIAALAAEGVAAHGNSGLNVWAPVADEAAATMALSHAGYHVAAGTRFRLASLPGIRLTAARLDDPGPVAAALAAWRTGTPHRGG
jgi:DNA-binding transcriptional MocR family regulator